MAQNFRVISTRLSRGEALLVESYCTRKGVTISSLIRDLLLNEIKVPLPNNVAGRNVINYNKETDSFSWSIKLDNDDEITLIKNTSPSFIKELQEKLTVALNERDLIINKKENNSVPVPDNIIRRGRNE